MVRNSTVFSVHLAVIQIRLSVWATCKARQSFGDTCYNSVSHIYNMKAAKWPISGNSNTLKWTTVQFFMCCVHQDSSRWSKVKSHFQLPTCSHWLRYVNPFQPLLDLNFTKQPSGIQPSFITLFRRVLLLLSHVKMSSVKTAPDFVPPLTTCVFTGGDTGTS